MLLKIISLVMTGILTAYVIAGEYKWNKQKAFVFGAIFFAIAFLFDNIFRLITMGFVNGVGDTFVTVIGIVISKSILIAGLIFLRVIPKETGDFDRETGVCYSDMLTIAMAAFVMALTVLCRFMENGEADIWLKIIFLIVLLIFFAGYVMSTYIHDRRQKEIRNAAKEAIARREADVYLENVENNYQRTRELWHDLKNHINLIKVLLEDEKYEELNDYLRVFNEDVDTLTLPVKSGNVVVDALLADKLGRAKKEGVTVTSLELCNLTGLHLKADDICGLLGNLLDNCLEANRKVAEGKFISVICKEQESCYYIKIENRAPTGMGEELKTTKSDKRNQVGHGLGIRSVERIVHGYGGDLLVENHADVFTVVVKLPKMTNNPSNMTRNENHTCNAL